MADKKGVFLNKQQADAFILDNCTGCSRYKRNCGILKKAFENRIQPEIDLVELKCIKNGG